MSAALDVLVSAATATDGTRPGSGGGCNRVPLCAAQRLDVVVGGVVGTAELPSPATAPVQPMTGSGEERQQQGGRRAWGEHGQEAGVQGQVWAHDGGRQDQPGVQEEDGLNPHAPQGGSTAPAVVRPLSLQPGPLAAAPVSAEHGWVGHVRACSAASCRESCGGWVGEGG